MKISKQRLKEIIREEFQKMDEDFGSAVKQLPQWSSKEAKKVVDGGLKILKLLVSLLE